VTPWAQERSPAVDLDRIFGDPAEFRRWYDAAVPRVYRYLQGRCGGDASLAEELTQQTFLEAVRHRSTFDGRSDPVTWLVAIARNKLTDHFRQLEREERRHLRLVVREIATDGGGASWERREARDEVLTALRGLPAAQRAALVLHYLDGLSVREVSVALGRSESATESLLSRGRERFKTIFREPSDA
jgi:RNA polymerase sigma factor (sigma-70 family)